MMRNIYTVAGITCRGHGCDWKLYARLIVIVLRMYTKIFCGGGGWHNIMICKEYAIKMIESLLI